MNVDKVDINKLPSDVRKTFKQMQLLLTEKKIQSKAKSDFSIFCKMCVARICRGVPPQTHSRKI